MHAWGQVQLGGATKNITPSFSYTTLTLGMRCDFFIQNLINLFT
jgi:hypothetical protein